MIEKFVVSLLLGGSLYVQVAFAGGDWNEAGIDWQPYKDGLAIAQIEKKPVCLIFYTEWCPHCINYSKVFNDPIIVELAQSFVMIRLDKDKHRDLSKNYAPDGEYIPRTYFLSPAGTLDPSIHAARPSYKYFYDEIKSSALQAGMKEALRKLR